MVFLGAEGNQKEVLSVVLPLHDEFGHHEAVVGDEGELAWPELGSLQRGGVNDDLISFAVKGGCGFQILNIRPMSQFSLSIGSQHPELVRFLHPLLALLLRG